MQEERNEIIQQAPVINQIVLDGNALQELLNTAARQGAQMALGQLNHFRAPSEPIFVKPDGVPNRSRI